MTLESGLYHSGHYDRSRPVASYWEATGGPEPAGVGSAAGRLDAPRWRSSAAATPGCRRPTIWRASMACRRSCSKPGRSAGAPPAATAASAAWAAASSATGAMAQRFGVPAAARFFAAQKAGVGAGPQPCRRRGDRYRARGRGRALSRPSRQPLARAREHGRYGAAAVRRALAALAPGRAGGAAAALAGGAWAAWSSPTISACTRCATCVVWRRPRWRGAPGCTPARRSRRGSRRAAGTCWRRRMGTVTGRAGAVRHQRLHARGPVARAGRAGCCRRCRASSSPGRSPQPSWRRRAGPGRR